MKRKKVKYNKAKKKAAKKKIAKKATSKKKKIIDRYDIDVKRCMFCGLREEACPTEPKAIWLTTNSYEATLYERNERLYYNKERLANWDGMNAFPGVVLPIDGQNPSSPMKKLETEAANSDEAAGGGAS